MSDKDWWIATPGNGGLGRYSSLISKMEFNPPRDYVTYLLTRTGYGYKPGPLQSLLVFLYKLNVRPRL